MVRMLNLSQRETFFPEIPRDRKTGFGQKVGNKVAITIENAKTEEDIERHMLWRPPPVVAVMIVPKRWKAVSGQEAVGLGAFLLETIRTVAPKAHKRWAAQHIAGA